MAEVKSVLRQRREHLHVTIDASVRKLVREMHKRTGMSESQIVDKAIRDGFASWDKSREQRITLDEELENLRGLLERVNQRVLLLVAEQNLNGLLAYPEGAPLRLPRQPETWGEWQGTLKRIRSQIEDRETRKEL